MKGGKINNVRFRENFDEYLFFFSNIECVFERIVRTKSTLGISIFTASFYDRTEDLS